MPDRFDFAIVALFSVAMLAYEHFIGWPRARAAIASGVPGARLRVHRTIMAAEWAFAVVVIARWAIERRSWTALGLGMPAGRALVTSVATTLAVAWLFVRQSRSVAAIPDERIGALREKLEPRFGGAIAIIPTTPAELRSFVALSVTAGICEELLFRGYAVWVFRPALGLWGAAVASILLFGVGHAYQGRTGALRATVVGALATALAVGFGSIIPGMIMHAIVDIGGGAVGYTLFRAR
jgi:membrane protease YdiL (CAAX protease family)